MYFSIGFFLKLELNLGKNTKFAPNSVLIRPLDTFFQWKRLME